MKGEKTSLVDKSNNLWTWEERQKVCNQELLSAVISIWGLWQMAKKDKWCDLSNITNFNKAPIKSPSRDEKLPNQ